MVKNNKARQLVIGHNGESGNPMISIAYTTVLKN